MPTSRLPKGDLLLRDVYLMKTQPRQPRAVHERQVPGELMRLCEAKESVFRRPSTSQALFNLVSATDGLRVPIERLISTTCQLRQARCARTAPAPAARLVPRRISPSIQDGGMHDRAKKGFEADPDPVAACHVLAGRAKIRGRICLGPPALRLGARDYDAILTSPAR